MLFVVYVFICSMGNVGKLRIDREWVSNLLKRNIRILDDCEKVELKLLDSIN